MTEETESYKIAGLDCNSKTYKLTKYCDTLALYFEACDNLYDEIEDCLYNNFDNFDEIAEKLYTTKKSIRTSFVNFIKDFDNFMLLNKDLNEFQVNKLYGHINTLGYFVDKYIEYGTYLSNEFTGTQSYDKVCAIIDNLENSDMFDVILDCAKLEFGYGEND